jgi:osmotically-inducible protein OsmY
LLRSNSLAGMGITSIEATVVNGKVTLSGTAIHQQLVADAEQAVRGIVGVKEVENRIVVVRSHSSNV